MNKLWSMSLPTRERGLKLSAVASQGDDVASLPTRERGLKQHKKADYHCCRKSLPTRERGLKLLIVSCYFLF